MNFKYLIENLMNISFKLVSVRKNKTVTIVTIIKGGTKNE